MQKNESVFCALAMNFLWVGFLKNNYFLRLPLETVLVVVRVLQMLVQSPSV